MNRYYEVVAFLFVFLLWFCLSAANQPYTLEVSINNQPDNPVVIGAILGDRFLPLDTLEIHQVTSSHQLKRVKWQFPANAAPSMYRLVFGQTVYARVMNEPPQQLDFVFNNENIVFETDFRAPQDSLLVVLSEENRIWFGFLREEKKLQGQLDITEMELNYYQARITTAMASPEPVPEADMQSFVLQSAQKANVFNQLQLEHNRLISNTLTSHERLYVLRLIGLFRKPLRDGTLSQPERKEIYQQEYFRYFNFSDESLIRTPVLTDKIFDYLTSYNHPSLTQEQREQIYIVAVSRLMKHIEPVAGEDQIPNPVYAFVLNYLVNGFEGLNMNGVLTYIAENYAENLCRTDSKTTLERMLKF
jgi:hypothetical protein